MQGHSQHPPSLGGREGGCPAGDRGDDLPAQGDSPYFAAAFAAAACAPTPGERQGRLLRSPDYSHLSSPIPQGPWGPAPPVSIHSPLIWEVLHPSRLSLG